MKYLPFRFYKTESYKKENKEDFGLICKPLKECATSFSMAVSSLNGDETDEELRRFVQEVYSWSDTAKRSGRQVRELIARDVCGILSSRGKYGFSIEKAIKSLKGLSYRAEPQHPSGETPTA